MPLRRILSRQYRSREVEWAIIYTFYLFVAVGLIISSAITIKYGNDFFADAATNPEITDSAGAAAAGGSTSGSEEQDPAAAAAAALDLIRQRRDALISAGVVSSIGLASGIVALVLNLASFITQTYLNSLWQSHAKENVYGLKLYAGLLIFAVNVILFGGNIALSWGFARASTRVSVSTLGTGAATPAYLRASAVMAGLVASLAIITAVVDYLGLRSCEKLLDARTGPQMRQTSVERNGETEHEGHA